MPATATIRELNGPVPTATVITAARFRTDDDPLLDAVNPIVVPGAGTNRSFWKSHELRFGGTFANITNVRLFTDGGAFPDVTVFAGDQVLAPGAYQQASGVVGDTGDEMVATHAGILAKTDVFTFLAAASKLVDAGPIVGPPVSSNHVVMQMDVPAAATPQDLPDETFTWTYDEI
jgi:hypothetical protein